MSKIKIDSVILKRTEGPAGESGKEITVDNLGMASLTLKTWSHTAPKKGYNKVDFTIVYENSESYDGEYNLRHSSIEIPNLRKHILNFVNFHAGFKKPEGMEEEEYRRLITADGEDKGTPVWYKLFIAFYKI